MNMKITKRSQICEANQQSGFPPKPIQTQLEAFFPALTPAFSPLRPSTHAPPRVALDEVLWVPHTQRTFILSHGPKGRESKDAGRSFSAPGLARA